MHHHDFKTEEQMDLLSFLMEENLNPEKKLNSKEFRLKVVLDCLNRASACLDEAQLDNQSEKIVKIMENLSSKL